MSLSIVCVGCGRRLTAPDHAQGKRGACPKCGTVVVFRDSTVELGPEITARPLPRTQAKPTPTSEGGKPPKVKTAVDASPKESRPLSPLGLAALILGLLALAICWIPVVNMVGVGVAALGGLLALIGLMVSAFGRRESFVLPIVGLTVCVIGGAVPVALYLRNAWTPVEVVAQPREAPPPPTEPSPPKPTWVEAGKPARLGDVEITIDWARIAPVMVQDLTEIRDRPEPTEESYLLVGVNVKNMSEADRIDYMTWRGSLLTDALGQVANLGLTDAAPELAKMATTLTDDRGKQHNAVSITPPRVLVDGFEVKTLDPGVSAKDMLIFRRPLAKFEYLDLALPGKNAGQSGSVTFRIPPSMVAPEPKPTPSQP